MSRAVVNGLISEGKTMLQHRAERESSASCHQWPFKSKVDWANLSKGNLSPVGTSFYGLVMDAPSDSERRGGAMPVELNTALSTITHTATRALIAADHPIPVARRC